MKKVLIVEDEILARLGLRQLVDWKKLDLELLFLISKARLLKSDVCLVNWMMLS